jgi:hypothetical protein
MSYTNNVASTVTTQTVPVQGQFDANGNCLYLIGPGGVSFYPPINPTFSTTNIYATSQIGYSSANYTSVTQSNNKTTGVTINTSSGQVVTANSQLAPSAQAVFTVTNSQVSARDNVICSIASGGTQGAYNVFIAGVADGSFVVVIKNSTNNAYSEAVTINFSILHTAS